MIALMTTQRAFAYVILAVVFIGGAFFAFAQMRKGKPELGSEIELAPNRKRYLPDEELEGPKLNKALWASFGLLVICAVIVPIYWLAEPGRQDGAVETFRHTFEVRGEEMYINGAQCVNCHGTKGVGGAASYVITDEDGNYVDTVNWTAPALNNLMYRFSVPEIKDILVYGRPGTPMPAWGVAGGGPNTDQQLATVIEYLWTIQLTPDEVHKQVDDQVKAIDEDLYDRMLAVRETNAKAAELDPVSEDFKRLDRADELVLGEILFSLDIQGDGTNSYSCARCHVPGASIGKPWQTIDEIAKGRIAPNLVGIEDNLTERQHYQLISNGTEFGKLYGANSMGSGRMPGFGSNPSNLTTADRREFGAGGMLSPEQIWSIVTYERNLSVQRPIADAEVSALKGDS